MRALEWESWRVFETACEHVTVREKEHQLGSKNLEQWRQRFLSFWQQELLRVQVLGAGEARGAVDKGLKPVTSAGSNLPVRTKNES